MSQLISSRFDYKFPVQPVLRKEKKAVSPGFTIAPTLEKFLKDSLSGKLQWKQELRKQGPDQVDTFKAKSGDIRLEMKGIHPATKDFTPPKALRDWEVVLTQDKTGFRKTLNGQTFYLPEKISAETDLTDQTLPKLFRAAYEAKAEQHSPLVPIVTALAKDLKDGKIGSTSSFIKPSAIYGPPTGIKLIQIGQGERRLEIAKVADQVRFTLHNGGKTVKMTEQILENKELFQALNELVEEANFQRTGKQGLGFDRL